jgi:hypothetical protein
LCISDVSADRFATALHRYRHPLKLGGQQWRRREKRKQRRRRPRSVGRRSRRCRCGLRSRLKQSRIASHGPAGVAVDRHTSRHDPPGRAGSGERQRASAGTEVWASSASLERDRAADHGGDGGEENFGVALASASGPENLRHLADALGVSTCFAKDLQRRRGPIPRRRFSLL